MTMATIRTETTFVSEQTGFAAWVYLDTDKGSSAHHADYHSNKHSAQFAAEQLARTLEKALATAGITATVLGAGSNRSRLTPTPPERAAQSQVAPGAP